MKLKEKEKNYALENENTYIINHHNHGKESLIIFGISVSILILIFLIFFCVFTISNATNKKIFSGIYIQGVDVANLTKDEAKEKLAEYIDFSVPEEIRLKHNDFETSIAKSQLSINFNLDEAIDLAYSIGRNSNIFKNNFEVLHTSFSKININSGFSIDEEQLKKSLDDISGKLPDRMIEASCYIDGNELVLTKGSKGASIDVNESAEFIKSCINDLTVKTDVIELITETKYPSKINIEDIYKEIHKEPVDAYFSQNPYMVSPSENGLDFAISLSEAKSYLLEDKDEYIIPLKVLYPNVTTNMIGMEAFPDLLSDFSTKYAVSNKNRTTNLELAASKIDGTVIMPGEVFSYNKIVGARTIEAGYKEAPIYVEGQVEDGLGGGICQITTTLYNAALYANLDIVARSNHQFVPSYAQASRDATVVYGAIDFKFKNNRSYPIKITCSVSNGIANFKIYGMKTDDDPEVEISNKITSTTSSAIYSEAYKILKKNGSVISTEVISRDTYKRH